MITQQDIADRIERLEALARELGQDAKQAQGQPEYASLLLDAIAGLDAARAVLVEALERMRGAQ